ncbi:unnamed protein product [Prorocentrum cordatum]|uniref:Subtilisin n=1 Tax=Prorocentrum cordatum TaxID=2364126 RepID=A0ABN9R0G4_9DINO|nr:unnamed protein product [Polarella glacialis]
MMRLRTSHSVGALLLLLAELGAPSAGSPASGTLARPRGEGSASGRPREPQAEFGRRLSTSGAQLLKLMAGDGVDNDQFGGSVAVSSDGARVVVGAFYDDDQGYNSGSAYVFDFTEATTETTTATTTKTAATTTDTGTSSATSSTTTVTTKTATTTTDTGTSSATSSTTTITTKTAATTTDTGTSSATSSTTTITTKTATTTTDTGTSSDTSNTTATTEPWGLIAVFAGVLIFFLLILFLVCGVALGCLVGLECLCRGRGPTPQRGIHNAEVEVN